MKKEKKLNSLVRLLKLCYIRIVRINDTPQKKALGFGLGVFLGILPGSGPIAALIMASFLRLNRASALLGSLLTNTWLSLVTFILAIKTGSVILKLNWQEVWQKTGMLIKDFSWDRFFEFSFSDVLLPLIVGYLIIGLMLGAFSYLITLIIIRRNIHGTKKIYP